MRVSAAGIAQLIPHAGNMCLLTGVVEWDENWIRCLGRGHRDPGNPLRVRERLPATSAIEYAAQAMATHGGLTGQIDGRPRAGYLVSLRDVACWQAYLDDLDGDLTVEAERVLGDAERVLYRFRVCVGAVEVVSGRAAVILDAGAGHGSMI